MMNVHESLAKLYVHILQLVIEIPVEHGLLLDNLLDLAHAPFTHTSTFAKGWSVPRYQSISTPCNIVYEQVIYGQVGTKVQIRKLFKFSLDELS